jgi:1-acyl-sn-glycerol-3-phosphate acyltransferase
MTVEPSEHSRPGRWRTTALAPFRIVYGIYAAGMFLGLGLLTLFVMLLLPGVRRRRATARAGARIALALVGMRLVVKGLERVPEGQCVVVSNHASYLDGIVFTAALPPRFSFVIKREMAAVPIAGVLLRALGSEFVDRFNRHRSATDARRVLRNALNGNSQVFFPEGTFVPTPGLLKFHIGAFATAARAGCPLVPAVVRGTRKALPPTAPLPSPGRIEVEILPAVTADAPLPDAAAIELRDRARAAILRALGEPDLSAKLNEGQSHLMMLRCRTRAP